MTDLRQPAALVLAELIDRISGPESAADTWTADDVIRELEAWLRGQGLDPDEEPGKLIARLRAMETWTSKIPPTPGMRFRLTLESTLASAAIDPNPADNGPTLYYGAEIVMGGYALELPGTAELAATNHTSVRVEVLP